MDNTVNASDFERIYETKQFWIGRMGGVQFESFYIILSDQKTVSSQIAVEIKRDDVKRIIDSNGDLKIVDSLARDLSNGYLYVK